MKKFALDFWYKWIAVPLWRMKRRMVLWRDRGRCKYCTDELSEESFTVDHVMPRSRGGSNRMSNLVACCKYCNKIKGDKLITPMMKDYMWHRAFQRHQHRAARRRKELA